MKAIEFYKNLEHILNNSRDYERDDLDIVIALSERSIGARASCHIASVYRGFDFENHQLRINATEKICRKENIKSVPKAIILASDPDYPMLRPWNICSVCGGRVSKDDNYCKHCGQKLSTESELKIVKKAEEEV